MHYRREKSRLVSIGDVFMVQSTLQVWSARFDKRKRSIQRTRQAIQLHSSALSNSCFNAWRTVLLSKKSIQQRLELTQRRRESTSPNECVYLESCVLVNLKSKAWRAWNFALELSYLDTERTKKISSLISTRLVTQWSRLTHQLLIAEARSALVGRLKDSHRSRLVPRCFCNWHQIITEKKRLCQMHLTLDHRTQRRALEFTFRQWQKYETSISRTLLFEICRLINEARQQRLIRMQSLTLKLQTELDELERKHGVSTSEIERLYERLQQATLQDQELKNRVGELERSEEILRRDLQREMDHKQQTKTQLNVKTLELEKAQRTTDALRASTIIQYLNSYFNLGA